MAASPAAQCVVAALAHRAQTLYGVVPARGGPAVGQINCWQFPWAVASELLPRPPPSTVQTLLHPPWPTIFGCVALRLIIRTAVYGPVRTVVWEGRGRETSPYPDRAQVGLQLCYATSILLLRQCVWRYLRRPETLTLPSPLEYQERYQGDGVTMMLACGVRLEAVKEIRCRAIYEAEQARPRDFRPEIPALYG